MPLLNGLLYPWRAFHLIRQHRELWGFVLVPILLNVVVGILLYTWLYMVGLNQIEQFGVNGSNLAAILTTLAKVVYLIGLAIGVGWLMVRFGVVLGAPWYGQLAGRLEVIVSGQAEAETPLSVARVAHDIGRALLFELKKLALTLAIGLPGLLLNFVPLLGNTLSTAIAICLGALIACLDFFDAPLERQHMRFRAKLGMVRQTFPASSSFGFLAAFLVSIPLLNLVTIPLCVAGGTLLVIEQQNRD
ncbi:EI24 domain-containing protein [Candidatus Oscillochloris fontis]|uniref:EI24 domain-containing protein n=1 Tax=Candidatus Oscillochloris fontis TaxID=2496868 RepID=UPI00101C1ACA|nr:EI24 domain-containing protein [Candidatus Oscillochloris fontis]